MGFKIEYYYLVAYLVLDICVFLLLICFVRKQLVGIETNNQVFMFISGFNFGFILMFTFCMFIGLGKLSYDQNSVVFYNEIGINSLLLSLEFLVFSYLLQLSGVILLLFLWFKIKKSLYLFIALGTLFLPFIILYLSLYFRKRFMSDLLTPLTYYFALVLGIIFFAKGKNDNIIQQINLFGPS